MNRTPLYEAHVAAGGKLVDFAGWEMPIQYSGVVDEYHAVRSAAGLFDVSHMGRFLVAGPSAMAYLQLVVTTDVARLSLGEAHYSMVCNEQGGIKDDIFIYHTEPQEYLLCVNASNRAKIWSWLMEQTRGLSDLLLSDQSGDLAQVALQGPAARAILSLAGVAGLETMKLRQCLRAPLAEASVLITRTGYTGEPGYELYIPRDRAAAVWEQMFEKGRALGLKPCGLGARDLLRLEMAYLLYGYEIGEDTTPLEASASWVVDFQKRDFVGKATMSGQKAQGLSRTLVGFELLERGVPRHGLKVLAQSASGGGADGAPIGEVTSGNFSPLLQKGIGLAYVPPSHSAPGTPLSIDIRGRIAPAVVVKTPFYQRVKRET